MELLCEQNRSATSQIQGLLTIQRFGTLLGTLASMPDDTDHRFFTGVFAAARPWSIQTAAPRRPSG